MPRVREADRKRAKRPKTKTGCGTCKIRKVKCGEERPECLRCTTTGRKCDGYNASKPALPPNRSHWTGKTSTLALATPPETAVATPASTNSSNRSLSPIPIQPSSIFTSDQERNAFAYFLTRTSPQLAGFYVCDFWSRVLPQAAHVDTGIRHAIIALSSVHRLFEETGDADPNRNADAFGMQQYQLAIRQHIEDMQCLDGNGDMAAALAVGKGKEGLERYLASSMLFICIEMLQGHFVSAISLIKVAVRLFYDFIVPSTWVPSEDSAPHSAWPLLIFETLFSRLQFKAIGLVGRVGVGVLMPPRIKKRPSTKDPVLPTRFRTVEEAKNWYDDFNWAHAFSSHDPEMHGIQDDLRDPVTRKKHMAVMDAWSSAFNSLVADLDPNATDQREKNAIACLQIRRLQTQMAFDNVVRDELGDCNPMLWDAHIPVFAEAIKRLEPVLHTQDLTDRIAAPPSPLSQLTNSPQPSKNRHLFTLDFGLVAPLFEIGRLCRDPTVRRRAIHLLRAHPMREGMWDSVMAARACEAQMEIEEGLATGIHGRPVKRAEDIPRDARIITMLPHLKPGQRFARTWFSKLPSQSPTDDRPREWHFEMIITW